MCPASVTIAGVAVSQMFWSEEMVPPTDFSSTVMVISLEYTGVQMSFFTSTLNLVVFVSALGV